ncbi:MAG: A/G-specific adenine glycosylase [Methanohalophilus sp. T328-1]|jgi:A/G-specific adenine glycosylase|nr:MAG: A/G-specific adenine glycosylase [Methanohalophilus sp. T328-1]
MIAEFMLQRTKAQQVSRIYPIFINQFPDIKSLVNADIEDIFKIIHPLGLHWRTFHFIKAAKYIENKYAGKIPPYRKELLNIPGIGNYTAGAILTLCFNKPEYVIDSNIARFINRFYGLELEGDIRRKKIIREKSQEIFNYESPGKLLYSILDFTALICKPNNIKCRTCHLKDICEYKYKNT